MSITNRPIVYEPVDSFIDAHLYTLNASAVKVFLAIYRATVGKHHDTKRSVTYAEISEATHLGITVVGESVRKLREVKAIKRVVTGRHRGAKLYAYRLADSRLSVESGSNQTSLSVESGFNQTTHRTGNRRGSTPKIQSRHRPSSLLLLTSPDISGLESGRKTTRPAYKSLLDDNYTPIPVTRSLVHRRECGEEEGLSEEVAEALSIIRENIPLPKDLLKSPSDKGVDNKGKPRMHKTRLLHLFREWGGEKLADYAKWFNGKMSESASRPENGYSALHWSWGLFLSPDMRYEFESNAEAEEGDMIEAEADDA